MATLNFKVILGFLCWNLQCGVCQGLEIHFSNGDVAPRTISVVENTGITFTCVNLANPPMVNQTVWRKTGDETFQVYNTELKFESIQITHEGTYTCMNQFYNSMAEVVISVLYPPDLPSISGPTVVIQPESISLTCFADSNPAPTFYWTDSPDNNAMVISRGRVYNTTIRSTNFYVYCWAENTMFPTIDSSVRSAQSQKVVVTGLEPVYIWELFTEYTFNVSSDLLIYCRFTGNPAPIVYWTKDGDSDFRADGDRLYIQNVQVDFTGYYSCHVENVLRPTGQPERTATDVKRTLITIIDTGIPQECREPCQRLVNEAKGGCDCDNSCVNANGCSNGIIAAAVVGWIIAGILLIVFLFCCIKHREQGPRSDKNKESKSDTEIEIPRSSLVSTRPQPEVGRQGSRPVLPVRPDVSRKGDDGTYSYITADDSRIDTARYNGMSGKYDYIGPDVTEPHDYLQLEPPSPASVKRMNTEPPGDGAKPTGVTNPTSSSVSTDRPADTNPVDDYLKSIIYTDKEKL